MKTRTIPTDLRITDDHVKNVVQGIRERRGGKGTLTKVAAQMILERAAQIELTEPQANVGGRKPAA